MPRKPRIAYPGAFYHVMSRGNEKKIIFKDAKDKHVFLKFIKYQHLRNKINIHAYCLMDNHYHMLIETPLGNISKAMQELKGNYAIYFNTRHNRVGHLFQGRYISKVVDTESYFRQLGQYIYMNPVKEKMCRKPEDYYWSSYKFYFCSARKPDWLVLEVMLEKFGSNSQKAKQKKSFQDFVTKSKEDEKFLKMMKKGTILGNKEFKDWLKDNVLEEGQVKDCFKNRKVFNKKDSIKRILKIVGEYNLDSKKQRKIITYLLRKYTALSLSEIADKMGIRSIQGVCMILSRFELETKGDGFLRRLLSQVETKLGVRS